MCASILWCFFLVIVFDLWELWLIYEFITFSLCCFTESRVWSIAMYNFWDINSSHMVFLIQMAVLFVDPTFL